MPAAGARERFRFGEFELDVAAYQLLRRGCRVRLERQPMDLLIMLVERRGTLVARGEIAGRLWPEDVFVEVDGAIHTAIGKIRRALRDPVSAPRFIENVPGKGYRFAGAVEIVALSDEGRHGEASGEFIADGIGPPSLSRAPAIAAAAGKAAVVPPSAASATDGVEAQISELRESSWQRQRALKRNLAWQFGAVVVGGFVLRQIPTDLRLPSLGAVLPTMWFCFVVGVALIYLWLAFGFLLDDAIKSRSEAWHLLSRVGTPKRAAAFNDGLFVDGRFLCFRPAEHTIDPRFRLGSVFFFTLFYCPLFAANHAFAIRLMFLWADAVSASRPSWSLLSVMIRVVPWLAVATIVMSHVQFRLGGRNKNWAQAVVGMVALGFLYMLFAG
jgi:DNA-binding winged helix-turn-helix (wHTH) protein